MNHFKSLKIGNNPLLLMGCSIIAFGVTHFYFQNDDSPKIANIIGNILLVPVYVIEAIASRLGFIDFSRNPVLIFFVLLVSYSVVALVINKIMSWRRVDSQ